MIEMHNIYPCCFQMASSHLLTTGWWTSWASRRQSSSASPASSSSTPRTRRTWRTASTRSSRWRARSSPSCTGTRLSFLSLKSTVKDERKFLVKKKLNKEQCFLICCKSTCRIWRILPKLYNFIGYFDNSLGFYKEEINANSHLKQPNWNTSVLNILLVTKFTANLYCNCLSIPHIYI